MYFAVMLSNFAVGFLSSIFLRAGGMHWVFMILAGSVGYLIGMLINYFADVLPDTRRFSQPLCRGCSQPFSIKEYLVAYRCSTCGKRRPARSMIVLMGAIAVNIGLFTFPFLGLAFWATLPLVLFLGVLVVIDIEHHLVLFETSLFGLGMCFVYGVILHGFQATLVGALAGFLIMLALYISGLVFSKIIGRLRGKKISEVAFGFGDVFAGTFLGMLAGWPLVAGAIVMAILAFGLFSLIYLLALILGKRYHAFARALPFVPFLIFGTIVILYI